MTFAQIRDRLPAMPPLTRRAKRLTGILGGLLLAYLAVLVFQNREARLYFQNMQAENPARYLDEIRKADGFDAYLDQFVRLRGYTDFQPQIPPFLVGRWTLKDAPERVAMGFVFSDCINPMVLEGGAIILQTEGNPQTIPVDYRIAGHDVYMRSDEFGLIKIGLVSYASGIDHLELVPPGHSEKQYAYLCGN